MKDHFREELKKFVLYQLSNARNYCTTTEEVRNCQAIAYGAVQYFINCCPNEYEAISQWWDEQKEQFGKIEMDKY